ncbi:MAG: acyltransferase family protein [Pseudomonadota bacterium]
MDGLAARHGLTSQAVPHRVSRREDIQLLRAFAVLVVLFYHADLGLFGQGFLGVDVFFVVSGFLMTGLILAEIDRGCFSFPRFLARRAARLLPASLATLTATVLAAPFLLSPSAADEFRAALFGTLTFTANIVFWLQTDYFAASADTRPLLHTWSLSLEEQFYFLLPAVLLVVPKNFRGAAMAVGIVLSGLCCALLMTGALPLPVSDKTMQSAAFFLLPTRAWELLIGGLAALHVHRHGALALPRGVAPLAFAVLVGVCAMAPSGAHPGPTAAAVALATALICAGHDSLARKGALTRVGDWSYSIYLIHWPLLAYANAAFLGEAPLWLRVVLSVLTIPLAALQYHYVETPFRTLWRSDGVRLAAGFAAASLFCAVLGLTILPRATSEGAISGPNDGLSAHCDQRGSEAEILATCMSAPEPRVALLGDSFAMQWADALAKADLGGVLQITKSACAPAPGLAPVKQGAPLRGPRACAAFMADAVHTIAKFPSIQWVVVAGSWSKLVAHEGEVIRDGELSPVDRADLMERLERLVRDLRDAGKQVVLMAPPPSSGLDVHACNERRRAGVLTFAGGDCAIAHAAAKIRGASVDRFLVAAAERTKTPLLHPANALCEQTTCRTANGPVLIYADRAHLTRQGAAFVAEHMGLRARLEALSPPKSP